MSKFINELNNSVSPDPENNVFADIWKQYERIVLHSLITSFGLDFLVHDQHGGDVDAIVKQYDELAAAAAGNHAPFCVFTYTYAPFVRFFA